MSRVARNKQVGRSVEEASTSKANEEDQEHDKDADVRTVELEGTESERQTVAVSLPDSANGEEAAAIAAAIHQHLRAEDRASIPDETKAVDRWELSTQLTSRHGTPTSLPPDVPADPWVTAGRL